MAKKKSSARRVPRTATPRTYSDGKSLPAGTAAPEAVANGAATNGHPRVSTVPQRRPATQVRPTEVRSLVPLSEEYHYVAADLKRLGIMAAGTFGLLIVLGMFIR